MPKATVSPKRAIVIPASKRTNKASTAPTATGKPATTKPVPASVAAPVASDGSTASKRAPSLKSVTAAVLTGIPADTNKPSGGGYVNRAATKPQLYGADHQSDRDNAYLRFFASFLRGKAPTSTIVYADIAERQRPANMRNPLPGAGGKNGAIDRGILSRFDKFGHTVNVVDPADKSRRIGFRFTDAALKLAAVTSGMRDVYENGLLRS